MGKESNIVVLGRISGLFGIRGWVKVHSYTAPREGILDYPHWLLERDGNWQPMRVEEGRRQGKTIVARFEGIEDRDQAADFIDVVIGVSREALANAGEGRFYWSDLEGLRVTDQQGRTLGKVAYLLETGANDVLVVEGDQEILIPFVLDKFVVDIDLVSGVIKVDWEWS